MVCASTLGGSMKKAVICAILLACAAPAWAQSLDTKESTLNYVATSLAEIDQASKELVAAANQETIAERLRDALAKVSALRDTLRNNPYVQVAGFSVGLPAGVSVEFTFPE